MIARKVDLVLLPLATRSSRSRSVFIRRYLIMLQTFAQAVGLVGNNDVHNGGALMPMA